MPGGELAGRYPPGRAVAGVGVDGSRGKGRGLGVEGWSGGRTCVGRGERRGFGGPRGPGLRFGVACCGSGLAGGGRAWAIHATGRHDPRGSAPFPLVSAWAAYNNMIRLDKAIIMVSDAPMSAWGTED
jgi:hypothetical protein